MEFTEATVVLEEGYCLWVGAGLTRQITGGRTKAPLWPEITQALESQAGLPLRNDNKYPERLQICFDRVGEAAFQKILRDTYYTQLCLALMTYAAELSNSEEPTGFIPNEARQVAALGQLANPLVNFNIEPLSSILIARPAAPVRVLPYVHPEKKKILVTRELHDRFQRLAYHPHGLITGTCVMTKSQYAEQNQTLAFTLAVQSAFGNNLAIVGMSLQDEYLRVQLERFRPQLKRIIWFDCQFDPVLLRWAQENNVNAVLINWNAFWDDWTKLKAQVDEPGICAAWYRVLEEAAEEAEGGALGHLSRALAQKDPSQIPEGLKRIAADQKDLAERAGEPGMAQMFLNMKPHEVLSRVRARITAANISLPRIYRTV